MPLPLSLVLVLSKVSFRVLLQCRGASGGKGEGIVAVLDVELSDHRGVATVGRGKRRPLDYYHLLSVVAETASYDRHPVGSSTEVAQESVTHVSPRIARSIVSAFPLFQLLAFPANGLSEDHCLC